jgi:hypothetical protein
MGIVQRPLSIILAMMIYLNFLLPSNSLLLQTLSLNLDIIIFFLTLFPNGLVKIGHPYAIHA